MLELSITMIISSSNSLGDVKMTEFIALKLIDVSSFRTVRITLINAVLATLNCLTASTEQNVDSGPEHS